MKNTILINPVDEEMTLLANAVLILNNYKAAGFLTRGGFVQLIMDSDPVYNNYAGAKMLNNFWACRIKDEKLNNDLVRIFDGLKTS